MELTGGSSRIAGYTGLFDLGGKNAWERFLCREKKFYLGIDILLPIYYFIDIV